MRILIILAAAAAFMFIGPVAWAQDQLAPCSAPEFRQFDFWLGDWDVFDKDGKKIGENRIALEQGGCVLHEHWRGVQGGTGESFNMYDAPRGVWHQTWVAASGTLLLLEGGLENGRMILSGERPAPNGEGRIMDRISWVPQDDGAVQQIWDQSTDGGKTWQTGFLGIYRKK